MKITIITIALFCATNSAYAQDAKRYTLEKTADGYVRLDNASGQMSICKEQGDQLVCRLAADDRAALQDGLALLEARLIKIEEKLASLESATPRPKDTLPTDEEFEKTIGYMEKFFRRFMGVVKELNETEAKSNKT